MAKDERDILEVLKEELDFIEKGGYGRSVRTPWQPKSAFQDSMTCINFGYQYRAHPCSECHLLDFVPLQEQSASVPCHRIPLNAKGTTVEDLEAADNQSKLEATVKQWLKTRIAEVEKERQITSSESLAAQRAFWLSETYWPQPSETPVSRSIRML
jgi:hypothetical protein